MSPPTPYIPGTYPTNSTGRGTTASGIRTTPSTKWGDSNTSGSSGLPVTRNGGIGSGVSRAGYSRAGTSVGVDNSSGKRPVTSNRAAGYSSRGRPTTTSKMAAFDPFKSSKVGSPQTESTKSELTPEIQVRDLERGIFLLLHDSAMNTANGKPELGLSKAKEATKRERNLLRQREQLGLMDSVNLDLTYCVLVNLAYQYQANHMFMEAIQTYGTVVKNKTFHQSGRLRINMGNLYLGMGKIALAVKMYRMSLDQLTPNVHQTLRLKVMHNLVVAFFRAGQISDAVTTLETIMDTLPDHRSGFHLVLCYYALGDRDKMRRSFQRLVNIPYPKIEIDPDSSPSLAGGSNSNHIQTEKSNSLSPYINSNSTTNTIMNDGLSNIDESLFSGDDMLRQLARSTIKTIERQVLLAAKLITKSIDPSSSGPDIITQTYDWLIETVRASPATYVANELEMAKAVHHLRERDVPRAVDCLKEFSRRASMENSSNSVSTTHGGSMIPASMAATNLSFISLLEGDFESAAQYADLAITRDRYNARAHCNRGTVYYHLGDMNSAKDMYLEAISLDAECAEATFNLGLTYKSLGHLREALKTFEKLHAMLRGSPDVVYNIAEIQKRMGNLNQALEWYSVLVSIVPTDPNVLAKLGDLHHRQGDAAQALHHYMEVNRYDPSHTDALAWLANHHVKCEAYESALPLFDRLAELEPKEIQWPLMAASCLRRSGNYPKALQAYAHVHNQWPQSIEALRFLVRLAMDVNAKEVPEWQAKLAKLESRMTNNSNGSRSDINVGGLVTTNDSQDSLPDNNSGYSRRTSRDKVLRPSTSIMGDAQSNNQINNSLFGNQTSSRLELGNNSNISRKEDMAEYNVEEMLP